MEVPEKHKAQCRGRCLLSSDSLGGRRVFPDWEEVRERAGGPDSAEMGLGLYPFCHFSAELSSILLPIKSEVSNLILTLGE